MPVGLARRGWLNSAGAACLILLALRGASVQQARQPAPPRPALGLALTGRVAHPRNLTLAELQALPAATVEVSRADHQGVQAGTQPSSFTGTLVWPLLEAAAPIDEDGPHTRLQHTLLARGQDGYDVALAIGELSPEFEGKQVLVAYAQDGKPLPALRLIVPADKRAGRAVRDLVSIEIR